MEGMDSDMGDGGGSGALEKLTTKLSTFLSDARSICSGRYLLSLIQLCHMDTQLASSTWVDLFPRLWGVLSDRHRQVQHGLISRLLSAFWLQEKPIFIPGPFQLQFSITYYMQAFKNWSQGRFGTEAKRVLGTRLVQQSSTYFAWMYVKLELP